ncbi:MAG: Uma2 family endonuclease [Cyanobacteria bacterium P01_F01_bin.86]
MTQAITCPEISLEAFLELPETKPASEYINGQIIQKPMPQGQHSRIQGKLISTVNAVTEDAAIALAFPELRCVFGGSAAIVPDVVVFTWDRIPFTEAGIIPNRFELAPDWAIEIASPEQSQTRLIEKLAHCLRHGTEVGWLIDPDDFAVTVFQPQQMVSVLRGDARLPVPSVIALELTVDDIFNWLRVGRR